MQGCKQNSLEETRTLNGTGCWSHFSVRRLTGGPPGGTEDTPTLLIFTHLCQWTYMTGRVRTHFQIFLFDHLPLWSCLNCSIVARYSKTIINLSIINTPQGCFPLFRKKSWPLLGWENPNGWPGSAQMRLQTITGLFPPANFLPLTAEQPLPVTNSPSSPSVKAFDVQPCLYCGLWPTHHRPLGS